MLTAHLGQGFYGQNVGFGTRFFYGKPKLLLQLEITYGDGTELTIGTDQDWLTHPSAVIKNNVYAGEVMDARMIFDPSQPQLTPQASAKWKPAVVSEESPTQQLKAQRQPPARIVRDVPAVQVLQPEAGVYVYDFGQNFTGLVTLDLREIDVPPGTMVLIRYSEWADDEGRINLDSDGSFATGVHQVDALITAERSENLFRPSFTWHGFRYAELTLVEKDSSSGVAEKSSVAWIGSSPPLNLMTGHLVRSDVATRGRFECSSDHLNRVHQAALWTYESNLIGLPTDCPIRERCGWTGDAHASLTMSNMNFDMAAFWEKYLGDFETSPHVSPSIVPGRRTSNSHPDWAVAQILIAWENYLHYGDRRTLEENFQRLHRFLDFFQSQRGANGIVTRGYGDWCDPVRKPGDERVGGRGVSQQTPTSITSTALLVCATNRMRRIAELLGETQRAATYAAWNQETAEAFHREFFDETAETYGSQTADSMALSFGIVPDSLRDAVANSLNRDVIDNWHQHASVGALGHRWLYPALGDAGYADTALGTFFAKGHPGFYYLFDELNGTSLWERKGAFDPTKQTAPDRSLSHPFQGGYDAWVYQGLGGIRPDAETPGYKHFILRPSFPKRLDWVRTELDSPYGMIRSDWQRADQLIRWDVTVPPNTTATIALPPNAKPMGSSNDNKIGPGQHTFRIAF